MRSAESQSPNPIIEMNTTPLIDVMLVLLVMFIITIPIQSHAVKLDLPTPCADCPKVERFRNHLAITGQGAILWNGRSVSKQQFAATLDKAARRRPEPELHLQPDPDARYELVDEVLALTKRSGITRLGFVGNERYAAF
jgi:biopolymer transport protein ExbD